MNRADKETYEKYLQKIKLLRQGATANPFETEPERIARIEKAKRNIDFFVEYYFGHYTDAKSAKFHFDLARKVRKFQTGKFIVRWGRGLAKSVWCDLIIPLWLWINDDIHYMVIVGNNLDKAQILLADLQAEFEANPRIIFDFGEQKALGSWEDGYFTTTNGFTAKALGMGQSPRGLRNKTRRPDYIVCDDLEDKDTLKNEKRQDEVVRWIEQDLLPTMDGPVRRYLHPNNNFAPRTIQEELRLKHLDWTLHHVDAYNEASFKPTWSEKYSDTYYKEVEKEIGVIAAQAEYNNKPYFEGKVFNVNQINWIEKTPNLNHYKAIIGHWDIAYSGKHDYNAIRVWGLKDKNFYYIASFVRQAKMNEALEWMCDFERQLPVSVTVHWQYESQFWNDAVREAIRKAEHDHAINLFLSKVDTPKTKKLDRILRMQPYYQNGRIYYPIAAKGDKDAQTGLHQLYAIEPGYNTHDDAPDADEQAILYLERYIRSADFHPRTGTYNKNKKRKW